MTPLASATPRQPEAPYVTDFSLSGTTFTAGETLTITANVTVPLGTLAQISFAFRLPNSTLLIPTWVGQGGSGTYAVTHAIDDRVPHGDYRLVYIRTMSQGQFFWQQYSHTEYDNVTYSDGSPVIVAITGPHAPDLVAHSVTVYPERPSEGGPATFTAHVSNDGGSYSPNATGRFLVDGAPVANVTLRSLAPSEHLNVTAMWQNPTLGAHVVTFVADVGHEAAESDETNNDASAGFEVTGGGVADLTVSALTASRWQDQVSFTATVRNVGNATSPTNDLVFRIDGNATSSHRVGSLPPGGFWNFTVSRTLSPGEHVIEAEADASGEVNESDESNNRRSISITEPSVDLAADSITVETAEPRVGEPVTFRGQVRNTQATTSPNVTIAFRIDGIEAHRTQVGPLPGGWMADRTFNWTPNASRSYLVQLVVDPDNTLVERNEHNNDRARGIQVAPPHQPNLAATILSVSGNATAGSDLILNGTFTNTGNASAGPFRAQLRVDGIPIANASLQALAPGGNGTLAAQWIATEGSHTVDLLIDVDDTVNETNESDNTLTRTIVVAPAPRPDLVASVLSPAPNATVGRVVNVTLTANNTGAAGAMDVWMALLADATEVGRVHVPAIAPGGAATRHLNWTPTSEGSVSLTLVVDPSDTVEETNESNNALSRVVPVAPAPRPDLVASVLALGSNATVGSVVNVTLVANNTGAADATDVWLALVVDGTEVGRSHVPHVPVGASVWRHVNWTPAAAGEVTLTLVVDPDNRVNETNESNNALSRVVLVAPAPRPDLVASVLMPAPNATVGRVVNVTLTVNNSGAAGATDVWMALLANGAEVGRVHVPHIPANGSATRHVEWTPASAGNATLTLVVDPDHRINETNESNNALSRVVLVAPAPRPDLVATGLTPAPNATVGRVVNVTLTANNTGAGTATDVWMALLANGAEIGRVHVPHIPANGSATRHVDWTPSHEGPATLELRVDPDHRIAETNESNNALSSVVLVAPAPRPNLVAEQLYVPYATAGASVPIYGVVANRGNVTSAAFDAAIVIDNATVADVRVPALAAGANVTINATWTTTPGFHVIKLIADVHAEVGETNETDNERVAFHYVAPTVDVGIRILGIDHEPLRTEAGDAPHPAPRHVIRVEIENRGDHSVWAGASFLVVAKTRGGAVGTSDHIGDVSAGYLAAGEKRVLAYEWDPVGVVGDVDVHARMWSSGHDPRPENDEDVYRDFVVVGGLGGIALPLP